MRKYRIVTAAIVASVCATTELHAQFSFMFGEKEQVVIHDSVQPSNACGLQGCTPKSTIWGHYPVSWRRWPEDINQYTTNPQLSPFVVPDRSGAPDVQVPDALDETLYSPRKRNEPNNADEKSDGSTTTPSPSGGPGTTDLPSPGATEPDPAADLLPDVEDSDIFLESPVDSNPEPSVEPGNAADDLFNDLDTGPTPDNDGGIDDLLNGSDSLDGFGNRQPRRYQRRSARESDSDRFSDFHSYTEPASLYQSAGDADDRPNPFRRKQVSNEPESVAYAEHYDSRQQQVEYRNSRGQYDDFRFDEPIDHRYDARQIDYREYQRRRNLYKYGDPREFNRRNDQRQLQDQPRNEDMRRNYRNERYLDDGYDYNDYLPKRAESAAPKSTNPLRR